MNKTLFLAWTLAETLVPGQTGLAGPSSVISLLEKFVNFLTILKEIVETLIRVKKCLGMRSLQEHDLNSCTSQYLRTTIFSTGMNSPFIADERMLAQWSFQEIFISATVHCRMREV